MFQMVDLKSRSLSVILLFAFLFLGGCISSSSTHDSGVREITVVHINDVYRIDRLAKVRTLRKELESQRGDTLFLHAGDMLFPSLMSKHFDGLQMIDVLNGIDGENGRLDPYMFSVFGNHEFDRGTLSQVGVLESAVEQSEFTWLSSNIKFSDASKLANSDLVKDHKILTMNGIKVGLFGLTIDTKIPEYATINTSYAAIAKRKSKVLRELGAEVVIALTHLNLADDKAILALGAQGPDVVYGGHEHYRFVERINGRPIIKADADALSASVSTISLSETKPIEVKASFEFLDERKISDNLLDERINYWNERLNVATCNKEVGDVCVNQPLAVLPVTLVGVEQKIRRFETNLGNWLSDIALNDFRSQGAQIAFLNSGGMRLNRDLPAHTAFTTGHLNELLPYKTNLVLIELTGAELQRVVDRSIDEWSANGWWLQVSGFAFEHDSINQIASNVSLISKSGITLVRPDDKIRAVTNAYLLDTSGGQDGYTFLNQSHVVPVDSSGLDLAQLVKESLNTASPTFPALEGRICNRQHKTPCVLWDASGSDQ